MTGLDEADDHTASMVSAATYANRLIATLSEVFDRESTNLQLAAEIVARTFSARGILYVFGSGHSHMLAEEAFYRAGGSVRVCPILKAPYMLHEGAVRSAALERESGHAEEVLEGYELSGKRDVILVVSNSGANTLPVEVARTARDRGLPVIAITSIAYGESIKRPGQRLRDVADVVLDNHCPPGDCLVALGAGLPGAGPASTVISAAIMNAIIVEAFGIQLSRGEAPQVFKSGNLPRALEHNACAVREMVGLVPHL